MKPDATCLDALSLPEEEERNLTDKQRGYYFAVRLFAAAAIHAYQHDKAPRDFTDGVLGMCGEALDEIHCEQLEKA